MTRTVPLAGKRGEGMDVIVDAKHHPRLSRYTWSLGPAGYVGRIVNKRRVILHREILGLVHAPRTLHVHHLNGDRLDNREENLCPLNAEMHFTIEHGQITVPPLIARAFREAARKVYGQRYTV